MYVMHKIACNCSHTYTRLYEYILTILHVVKVFSPNGSCMYPLCITLAFMSFSAVFQLSSARCTTPLSRHVSFHFASFATHICIHQVCALHAYTHTHTHIVNMYKYIYIQIPYTNRKVLPKSFTFKNE